MKKNSMHKKKLLINASILSSKNTGLGEYTFNVLNYVAPLLKEAEIEFDVLCSNADLLPEICRDNALIAENANFIKRNLQTKKILKHRSYDLIWSTTQHGVIGKKCRQIITVHDLTPLKYPQGRLHQYIYYKYFLPKIIKRSLSIFTISQNTKRDLIKYYKRNIDNKEKIKVLYESINVEKIMRFREIDDILEKFRLGDEKYFCITGIHYYYKNIHSVIEAFAKESRLLPYKVVIIGNDRCSYAEYLKRLISHYHLTDNFVFTGYIDSDRKNTLIKHSLASIYPSLYEGFGLPLLESMLLEIPIIASDASSLPEIGGDAAIYFAPDDIDDLKEKLLTITTDSSLRLEMIEKGRLNVKRFDWNEIAKNTFEFLRDNLENKIL